MRILQTMMPVLGILSPVKKVCFVSVVSRQQILTCICRHGRNLETCIRGSRVLASFLWMWEKIMCHDFPFPVWWVCLAVCSKEG